MAMEYSDGNEMGASKKKRMAKSPLSLANVGIHIMARRNPPTTPISRRMAKPERTTGKCLRGICEKGGDTRLTNESMGIIQERVDREEKRSHRRNSKTKKPQKVETISIIGR